MAVEFKSHQVDILFNSDPVCAGTLISSYLVLTVLSCLNGKNEEKLKVRASQSDAAGNFQTQNVDTIHSLPALKSEPTKDDIAVILLDSDFNLDDSLSLIGSDSNEPQGFIALSQPSSSCGSFPVEKTDQYDCNRTTDNPNSICVKPSHQSSCPVPLMGSGLICQIRGIFFLCGALAGNGASVREYTDISKYLHWIRLTFGTRQAEENEENHAEYGQESTIFRGREVSSSGVSSSIPYQLSLQVSKNGRWSHICGAVIIDEKTALTAAHCFDKNLRLSDYRVVAGVTHLNSTSSSKQILPLQEIIRHHRYKIQKWFKGNDIAIVHVEGSFIYNENVKNIWISPPNGTNSTDFPGRVSGWGKMSTNGQPSNSLQEADMKILPDSECNKIWPKLHTPSMICSYDNESNTCEGDSGGPLVIQNYQFNQKIKRDLLVGIASFSPTDCEKRDEANGFTEVSHFYNWIKKNRGFKCGANEFQCLNGGCIHECSLCNGADECGDGSTEKQCEQEMDVSKMRRCLRKNQHELSNVTYSLAPNIQVLEEEVGKLRRMLQVEDGEKAETGRQKREAQKGDRPKRYSSFYSKDSSPFSVTRFENKTWQTAATLFKAAQKTERENLVFSPLSLTTSMLMLNEGAEGDTAKEIQTLFKLPKRSSYWVQNQTVILNSLKHTNTAQGELTGVTLETASRIYANIKNSNLLSNYKRAVSSLGGVETLDFTDPKPVVAVINWWVNYQTQGKISNIVGKEDFNVDTAAVLLNTLYFKAPWKTPFDKSDTQMADFHVSEDETVKVEMMHISEELPFVDLQEVEASAVFLPYKGDRLSMIIYLPWEGRDLTNLEKKLESLVPALILNAAETTSISLYLPKLNISSSLDFKEILTSLGVQSMFNRSAADFSKMSESPKFHVSKLVQQVFVQVNEEGAEPAALTESNFLAQVNAPTVFKVDRPFIFQIYDSVTSTILLTGRVTNPNGNPAPTPTRAPPTTTIRTPSRSSLVVRNIAPNSKDYTDPNCSSVEKARTNNNPTLAVTPRSSNQTASNCLAAHGAKQPKTGKNVSQLTEQLQCITETIKKLQVNSCRKSESNAAILYPYTNLQRGDAFSTKFEHGSRCLNLPPNWVQSVYVKEGRCVQLYEEANCHGRHLTVKQSVHVLTNGRLPKSIKNC